VLRSRALESVGGGGGKGNSRKAKSSTKKNIDVMQGQKNPYTTWGTEKKFMQDENSLPLPSFSP